MARRTSCPVISDEAIASCFPARWSTLVPGFLPARLQSYHFRELACFFCSHTVLTRWIRRKLHPSLSQPRKKDSHRGRRKWRPGGNHPQDVPGHSCRRETLHALSPSRPPRPRLESRGPASGSNELCCTLPSYRWEPRARRRGSRPSADC